MTPISKTLASGCQTCHKTTQLNTCGKCKVVQYCGREHQVADWPEHKNICKKVSRAGLELLAEQEEAAALDAYAGRFAAALPGGADLDVLLKLATLELEVNNRLGIQQGLSHVLEMTKSAKTVMVGTADLAPVCFLRLGRDQEAYDFMKWWITTPETIMGPPRKPYTAVRGEDILESTTIFKGNCPSLAFMAALTLLKLRLLMDLQSLQRSRKEMPAHLPQELLDEVRKSMVSSAINKSVIEREDHADDIKILTEDVKTLYQAVKASSANFWPGVLHPEGGLVAESERWFHGKRPEMQIALQYTYNAWTETPGAIDAIDAISEQQ
jgi:hypothetical protein